MDNIELIERILKYNKQTNVFSDKVSKALSNIITDYKKLKEENDNYKLYSIRNTVDGLIINGKKFSFNDYIETSKIKERVDLLTNELDEYKNTYKYEKDDDYFFDVNAQESVIMELLNILKGE